MSDRPLHILTITSMYPTPQDPGLGAFVASQVQSLQTAGLNVNVLFLDMKRTRWELARGIFRVRKQLASKHYDLVHAHFGYNGIPACLQNRAPVVISFCGTDLVHPKLRPISRWVARRANACIVKSSALLNPLGYPASVIPNGVNLDRFQPGNKTEARSRLNLDPSARYALFAANPARPEKQYSLAEAAVQQAHKQGLALELLRMHNRPQEEVPHYLNAADILLLTSTHEGSPNVVKEAMACNLPIVSTDVGDVRNLLSNTHHTAICDPTPEALAAGLTTVLSDSAPSNGRDHIKPFSAEVIAARIITLYRQVLENGTRP
ncbi:MAG: glycosyltransferase [bacterium]|nr:glycosyltransferase [bacterium]